MCNNLWPNNIYRSYAYWTVHHLDIWIKVDQLDDTCFICTRIPHHQQTIPLHNTSTPQVSLHNATNSLVQPALGYHITNRQSRYITPTRLKSAQYSLHNATSSRMRLKMDVLTSETCWAVDNKASVIKLVNLYSNIYRYLITKHYPTWIEKLVMHINFVSASNNRLVLKNFV